jgi:GntR family transcriptional regulator
MPKTARSSWERAAANDKREAAAPMLSEQRSPIPLYHRLQVILRDRIATGAYREGDALPSEAELTKEFGVSRITAKRALDELSTEGLVERARGRGTTVIRGAASGLGGPIIASIDGLLENLSAIGREGSVELLEFGYLPAPHHVALRIGLSDGAVVQRAVRVRFVGGAPMSQSTSFVVEKVGRSFDEKALAMTPLIVLLARAGVAIGSAEQSLTAVLADSIVAPRLRVAVGSPLIMIKRVLLDASDTPVEYLEALYRPDRFEYRMNLPRADATAEAGASGASQKSRRKMHAAAP